MNMKQATTMNTEQLQKWLPNILSAIIVILIAYTLVNVVWLFLAEPEEVVAVAPQNNTQKPNKAPKSIEFASAIVQKHLFGEAEIKAPDVAPSAVPLSQLNLKLRGIIAIGEEDGLAIIAKSNKEQVYKVGENVAGNAKLKAVYADSVILESSRGLEKLELAKDKPLFEFSEARPSRSARGQPVAPANNAPAAAPQSLAEYRKQFIRNPAALAEIADVAPVQVGGKFQGFRIKPKKDDPVFGALGLEDGDIVTTVNGIALDKPENGIKALRKLSKAKRLDVTVLRNGSPTQIQHQIR